MKFLILLCNAKSKDDAPKAEVTDTQEKVEINLDELNWFQRLFLRLILRKQFKELVEATKTDTLHLNKSR